MYMDMDMYVYTLMEQYQLNLVQSALYTYLLECMSYSRNLISTQAPCPTLDAVTLKLAFESIEMARCSWNVWKGVLMEKITSNFMHDVFQFFLLLHRIFEAPFYYYCYYYYYFTYCCPNF